MNKKKLFSNIIMLLVIVLVAITALAVAFTHKLKTNKTSNNKLQISSPVDADEKETVGYVTEADSDDDTQYEEPAYTETTEKNSDNDSTQINRHEEAELTTELQTTTEKQQAANEDKEKEPEKTTEKETTTEKLTEILSSTENAEPTTTGTTEEAHGNTEITEEERPVGKCSIYIDCSVILDNMDKLKEGKEEFVPESGFLLGTTTVNIYKGDNVFSVLKRVCQENGIQLEYSYAPLYKTYYVEGIGNIYEFDCGKRSGWTYYVNGDMPNCGMDRYELSGEEEIAIVYTR